MIVVLVHCSAGQGGLTWNYRSNFGWAGLAGVGSRLQPADKVEQMMFVCHAMNISCTCTSDLCIYIKPERFLCISCRALMDFEYSQAHGRHPRPRQPQLIIYRPNARLRCVTFAEQLRPVAASSAWYRTGAKRLPWAARKARELQRK